MEAVKGAKEKAKVLIGHGSTTVFVAEEILGKEKFSELMNRNSYLSGLLCEELFVPFWEKKSLQFWY